MPKKGWRKSADGVWEPPKTEEDSSVSEDSKEQQASPEEPQSAPTEGPPVEPDGPGLEPICQECWPDGWPDNSGDAECSHGHYHRDLEE